MKRSITKIIHTETGHRLTSYPHRCAHLHGHSLKWEVSVSAEELDATGFIIDFSDLKEVLKETVDTIDHAFILHDQDPLVLQFGFHKVVEVLRATNGDTPRLHILPFNPTSENIIVWMSEKIQGALPQHVTLDRIKLWETAGSYTVWEK